MWWNGPMWGNSWGPLWMLVFPLLFLLCLMFMAYVSMRRGFPFWYCGSRQPADASQALIEEIRKLRLEIEELRKEIKR